MKRRMISLLLIAVLLLGLAGCSKQSHSYTITGTFDTVIQLICYTDAKDAKMYGEQAQQLLEYWNSLCDAYHPWADAVGVYTLNQKAGQWVDISADLQALLTFGKQVYTKTDGVVNLMGGALTTLWKNTQIPPAESDIAEAKKHIDISTLEIQDGRARITDKAAAIDVGAFAKGYALQKTADALREAGFRGLLSAVSSVVAVGDKQGQPFSIGLSDATGGIAKTVALEDGQALSTSGTEQRYFIYQDKKYHHIIDLTTGYPADSGVAQVSVLDRDAGWADVWSTAALITGQKENTEWIRWEDNTDGISK